MTPQTKAPAAGKLTGAQDNSLANRLESDSSMLPVPIGHPPEIAGARANDGRSLSMDDRPDLLPVKPDLCELTGLSAQTLRSLINKGGLPGCRIGRRLYVPKSQFIAYIEKGEL